MSENSLSIKPILVALIITIIVSSAPLIAYFTILQPMSDSQKTSACPTTGTSTTFSIFTTEGSPSSPIPTPTTFTPLKYPIYRINTTLDLINLVYGFRYNYTSFIKGNESTFIIDFEAYREDYIGSIWTYKVFLNITYPNGKTLFYTAWIDKITGALVQLELPNSTIISGLLAASTWKKLEEIILWPWSFFPKEYYDWSIISAYYKGSRDGNYGRIGGTTFVFSLSNPNNQTKYVEFWVYPDIFLKLNIVTMFYVESTSGDWWRFQVVNMTLRIVTVTP